MPVPSLASALALSLSFSFAPIPSAAAPIGPSARQWPGAPGAAQIGSGLRAAPPHVHPCPARDPGVAVPATEIVLGGPAFLGCHAGLSMPFSARFAPDERTLYVPLMGGLIGLGGCLIAKVDSQTRAVIGTFQVGSGAPNGESPIEVAFTTGPEGALRHGWVSNSSSSSVSVFDARDRVVAEIALPFDAGATYPTAFPFGLAVAPDGARVFVGTVDGSGRVFVLDAQALVLLSAETLELGAGRTFGRPLFAGERLVLPATRAHPGGLGSTAELILVDPAAPGAAQVLALRSSQSVAALPSAQDVALWCERTLFVAGFDMGRQVLVVDLEEERVRGGVPTHTGSSLGKYQALGLSSNGLLAVADLYTDETALIDAHRERWIATLGPADYAGPLQQIGELVFSPDGGQLFAPGLLSENLAVFDVLP